MKVEKSKLLNSEFAAEKISSEIFACSSIEPPISINNKTLTLFFLSALNLTSKTPPFFDVNEMVLSISNSISLPCLANFLSLLRQPLYFWYLKKPGHLSF